MTIKLFIGTSPNGEDRDIEMTYEYSIKKNTSADIDITWMKISSNKDDIWGGWDTSLWFTPFSGFRWAIPHACNFEGIAIYTDVDMINFKDIEELAKTDLKGRPFAARKGKRFGGYELCVMVIDCEKAKKYIWDIERLKNNPNSHEWHRNRISGFSRLITPLNPLWNCLDGEKVDINDIYQLHYTKMASQPWKPAWFNGENEKHARDDIEKIYWDMKEEAIQNGCKPAPFPEQPIEYKIIGQ